MRPVGQSAWLTLTNGLAGDYGTNVTAGLNKTITWWAEDVFGYANLLALEARLTANGYSKICNPFAYSGTGQSGWSIAPYFDLNGNGRFDQGELAGANVDVYVNSRSNRYDTTGSSGLLEIGIPITRGMPIFARKAIHSAPAHKSEHEIVDGVMYTLTMDSDVGRDNAAWDGVWSSYTITEADRQAAERNEHVYIKLGHPVFEWNVTVDYEQSDMNVMENLFQAVGDTSRMFYKTTYGQMKLGKVYLSSAHTELTGEDVRIDPSVTLSHVLAAPGVALGNDYPVFMQVHDLADRDFQPFTNMFAKVLMHEFGHHILGLFDEYKVGWGRMTNETKVWKSGYPDLFQSHYGLMDSSDRIVATMSANNDYIADYRNYVPADFVSVGRNELSRIATWVTAQIFGHDIENTAEAYPCWEWVQHEFDGTYSGIPVSLIGPPNGLYVNGQSTSTDRSGTFTVPAPYDVCRVRIDNGDWRVPPQTDASAFEQTRRRTPSTYARVTDGDQPVIGAQIAIRKTTRPFRYIGRTDADGQLLVDGLDVGDILQTYWRGRKAEVAITSENIRSPRLDFGSSLRSQPLSTEMLGMRVSCSLMFGGQLQLNYAFSHPLATNPIVEFRRLDGSATNITLMGMGDMRQFTGACELENEKRGFFDISATATNGTTFHTLDLFSLLPVIAGQYLSENTVVPNPDLAAYNTTGIIYYAYGPIPVQPGMPTNQIGPGAFFTTLAGELATDRTALFQLPFADENLDGVARDTIALWQWNDMPGSSQWERKGGNLDLETDELTYSANGSGHIVLLADSTTDATPPAAIADLRAKTDPEPYYIQLDWTAPGDDGTNGTASAYDLRAATAPLDADSWSNAPRYFTGIAPSPAGSAETLRLRMNELHTTYYVGIKAMDAAGNLSPSCTVVGVLSGFDDANNDGVSDQWLASVEAKLGYAVSLDDDPDNDALSVRDEYLARTDPTNWDTDGDGMSDGYEVEHGLNPLDIADSTLDPDNDGLTNYEESQLGTDPNNPDTSGDGMSDGWKVARGLDPLTNAREEGADADPDADTFTNLQEYIADTDPFDEASFLQIKNFETTPDGIALYLDASTARVFSVQSSTNLTGAIWQTVDGPHPGQGENTRREIPALHPVEFFNIEAEVP